MAFTHTVRFNPNLIELTDAIDKTTTVNYSKIYNNEITGYPSLPIKYLKFILPQDSKVEDISINSTSYTFANDIIVTSGLQKNMDGSESISKPNNDIYHQNTPYPEHQAELKEHTNYDGNVRVVTIAFYPIQYVPGLKQLIFNEEIEIELNYSNSLPAHVNPIYSYTHHIEENKAFLNSIIANNNDIEAYYPPRIGLDISASEQPDLIIIGKASLEDSFDRYIEWKKQKGYRVAYKTIESIEASYTGDDVAWYDSNSGKKTHNVGTKAANELGIFDMSGNVYEWCWDWSDIDWDNIVLDVMADPNYDSSHKYDPKGPDSGTNRISCGGAWSNGKESCVTFISHKEQAPSFSRHFLGFRVVRNATSS